MIMNPVLNKARRSNGFTLLELVVAIAIFSIISTASAYFIRNVLLAQDRGNEIATQLEDLQKVWLLLQQDIEQVVARSIRDQHGDQQPALSGDQQQLAFTRIGWPLLPPREILRAEKKEDSKGVLPRSEVLRVRYYLENEQLMRAYWPVPDQAEDAQPQISTVLSNVKSMQLQYVFSTQNAKQQTSDVWPPDPAYFPDAPVLPQSVKVTLTFDRYGELYRWFEILNHAPISALFSGQPTPSPAKGGG